MAQRQTFEAAIAIIERDGCVLVAQRDHDTVLGGLWEFPGGKLLPGEDPRDAVRREVREEMDVEVEVLEELLALEHEYPYGRVRLRCFHCRLVAGEPRPIASLRVQWTPVAELAELDFPPANTELLQLIARRWGRSREESSGT